MWEEHRCWNIHLSLEFAPFLSVLYFVTYVCALWRLKNVALCKNHCAERQTSSIFMKPWEQLVLSGQSLAGEAFLMEWNNRCGWFLQALLETVMQNNFVKRGKINISLPSNPAAMYEHLVPKEPAVSKYLGALESIFGVQWQTHTQVNL